MEKFVQSVQQPKPLPPKRPFTLFLEDSVDQLPSNPALKRHHPESVVIQWLESISGSESYRERRCRSDTPAHSDGELIPRRLIKSAPNIEYTRDAEEFIMPPTPISRDAPSVVPQVSVVPLPVQVERSLLKNPLTDG